MILAGLVVLPPLLLVLVGWPLVGRGTSGQFAAQIPRLSADYLQAEGHARRGAKFEQLALALSDKALSGSPPTEAEMVRTLGPPDLMQSGPAAGDASFVYFYDRFGRKDWAVFASFQSGQLTIGYNDASVNASTYTQMRPYAPLPATVPAATVPITSPR